MQDIHQALRILRDSTGLNGLAFNADGQAEIVVEDVVSIYMTRISDAQLEFSCRLPGLPVPLSETVMRGMLSANCLGGATAFARLGIDEANGGAVLCQRVDATAVDAAQFEELFTDFVRHAAYWQTQGTADLLRAQGGAKTDASEQVIDSSFLRV